MQVSSTQSKTEEFWNAATHALGIVLGITGLIVLLKYDSNKTAYSTISIVIYALSIIVLFSASTMYHLAQKESWKKILRKFDHISIYYLIAGTYTPVALITLEHSSGWWIFWTVWGIAVLGTILKVFYTGRFEKLSLSLYILMGWLIIFDISTLIQLQSELGTNLLVAGGLFYTSGTFFYVKHRIPFNHVIWHLFVLFGSIAHFLYIFFAVI